MKTGIEGEQKQRRELRRIERRFLSAVTADALIPRGATVLVGISGGTDSTALLLLLARFAGELGYRFEAAYFDHQIRTEVERAVELKTVQTLTGGLGVPLRLSSAPVRDLARRHGRSLEEGARIERYSSLARAASDCDATLVAVGHTADDQAETVLLHIIRGSGIRGLRGMSLRQPWPVGRGPVLIRPLLDLDRKDTETYCRLRGATPHLDSQNSPLDYARNRVRHEILPAMERLNPRVKVALRRLATASTDYDELVREFARSAASPVEPGASQETSVSRSTLQFLPAGARSELLAEAYAHAAGSRRGLSARHFAALERLLVTRGEHSLNLPAGVLAHLIGEVLSFETVGVGQEKATAAVPQGEIPLPVPGCVRFGDWELTVELIPPGTACGAGPSRAVLAANEAAAGLIVRSRRPGDRMRPAGMNASKKLQDIFVDAKVPRSQRDAIPLVCLGAEIVWAVGVRKDVRATEVKLGEARVAISVIRIG